MKPLTLGLFCGALALPASAFAQGAQTRFVSLDDVRTGTATLIRNKPQPPSFT